MNWRLDFFRRTTLVSIITLMSACGSDAVNSILDTNHSENSVEVLDLINAKRLTFFGYELQSVRGVIRVGGEKFLVNASGSNYTLNSKTGEILAKQNLGGIENEFVHIIDDKTFLWGKDERGDGGLHRNIWDEEKSLWHSIAYNKECYKPAFLKIQDLFICAEKYNGPISGGKWKDYVLRKKGDVFFRKDLQWGDDPTYAKISSNRSSDFLISGYPQENGFLYLGKEDYKLRRLPKGLILIGNLVLTFGDRLGYYDLDEAVPAETSITHHETTVEIPTRQYNEYLKINKLNERFVHILFEGYNDNKFSRHYILDISQRKFKLIELRIGDNRTIDYNGARASVSLDGELRLIVTADLRGRGRDLYEVDIAGAFEQ